MVVSVLGAGPFGSTSEPVASCPNTVVMRAHDQLATVELNHSHQELPHREVPHLQRARGVLSIAAAQSHTRSLAAPPYSVRAALAQSRPFIDLHNPGSQPWPSIRLH